MRRPEGVGLMPLKGAKKHTDRLRKLSGPEVVRIAGAVVYEGADMIRAYAHQKISAGSVSGKGHEASAPGDFPNRDTGILQANIEARQTGALTAEVVSRAPYAAALEFGSERKAGAAARSFAGVKSPYGPNKIKYGPVKMEFGDSTTEARPYMRPSRDAKEKEIRKRFASQMNKLVKRSG